jgi:hypothetical protein
VVQRRASHCLLRHPLRRSRRRLPPEEHTLLSSWGQGNYGGGKPNGSRRVEPGRSSSDLGFAPAWSSSCSSNCFLRHRPVVLGRAYDRGGHRCRKEQSEIMAAY